MKKHLVFHLWKYREEGYLLIMQRHHEYRNFLPHNFKIRNQKPADMSLHCFQSMVLIFE